MLEMARRAIRAVRPVVVAIALLGVVVHAQNSKWSEPYNKALDAIKNRKYQDAVPLLETAIKANAKPEAAKYIEGVVRVDYFPYYWLGVAYFELHQYDK